MRNLNGTSCWSASMSRWSTARRRSASAALAGWLGSPASITCSASAWSPWPVRVVVVVSMNGSSLPAAGRPPSWSGSPRHHRDLHQRQARRAQVLRGIEPGGSRLTDLAAAARMTKQSMGALVDHLEEAGYAERVHDPLDGRVKAIRLTRRGRQAAETIAAIGTQIETAWADKIGHRRLEQLREALAAITLDLPER